jgi:hypothetical protein
MRLMSLVSPREQGATRAASQPVMEGRAVWHGTLAVLYCAVIREQSAISIQRSAANSILR